MCICSFCDYPASGRREVPVSRFIRLGNSLRIAYLNKSRPSPGTASVLGDLEKTCYRSIFEEL